MAEYVSIKFISRNIYNMYKIEYQLFTVPR